MARKISKEEVGRIAELARLRFNSRELEGFTRETKRGRFSFSP